MEPSAPSQHGVDVPSPPFALWQWHVGCGNCCCGLFQLNMRKNFFPLRVTEPWPRLPREAVESPSLEIFKTHLDKVLYSLLWVTLLGQGVGLGDPQRSLSPLTILCDSLCVNLWRPG